MSQPWTVESSSGRHHVGQQVRNHARRRTAGTRRSRRHRHRGRGRPGARGVLSLPAVLAVELAETRCFEDVWHLLVHGELPDAGQAVAFRAETAALRRLPDEVRRRCPRSWRRADGRARSPVCARPCRCSVRRRGSGRCTTSTRTSGDGTRSRRPRRCRRCWPRCTGWARGSSRWSRVRISRTRRTTCTC